MQSYYFVYWTYIKKTCEWGPVYIEKIFPGVTLPALVNLNSDFLALTELTRLGKPRVCLEKGWLSWEGDLNIKKGLYPSPVFVSSVIKRQLSARKCSKCWLAQVSSGRRVTLLPRVSFLHIRGDHAALGRPHGIGWTNKVWARFSKVPIINGPGRLLPFTLKIEISIVLHQHDKTIS